MQARGRKKILPVIGTGASSALEGVAPAKRDFWEISVSRLKEDTTGDKVKSFLQTHGIEVKDVFVFSSKIKGTVAAKVRVALEHKQRVKESSLWPPHVRVQDWIYRPKSAQKENNAEA